MLLSAVTGRVRNEFCYRYFLNSALYVYFQIFIMRAVKPIDQEGEGQYFVSVRFGRSLLSVTGRLRQKPQMV